MRFMAMAASLVVAALVAVPTAAGALEGRLLRPDGTPVRGARVQVLGERETAVVDEDGRFSLTTTQRPPFDVLITRSDGVVIQPMRVAALASDGTLVLTLEGAMQGSVTVLGAAPDLELPPAAAFTLSGRGDLDQRAPRQLGDVMATIPGTEAVGNGPAAVPAIRGMTSARTLILLDEGRVTAERRAGPSATFLDPATVEEIEVVRGPGSVAYGSDAFGGLIRARTRIQSPGDAPALAWSLTAGSNDSLRAADAEYGFEAFGGGMTLGAGWRDYDDYSSPRGEVPLSGWRGFGGRLGYQRELGSGVLRALWRTDLARDVGKPATDSATRPTWYPEENSHRFSLSYEQPGPGSWERISTHVFWAEYQLLTTSETVSEGVASDRTVADVFSHDWGVRLEGEHGFGRRGRLVLGLDTNGRFGLQATNEKLILAPGGGVVDRELEVSIEDASRWDLGVFAGVSTVVGQVGMSGGIRVDRVQAENRGGYFGDDSQSDSALSGFVAVSVPLAQRLELSVQAARGFRDALLSDRFYRGLTGRGFITGNPDLEPETSRQLDLALRYSSGSVTVAGYAYLYRIEDLIERYRAEDRNYYFRNRGEAEVRGLELELLTALGRSLLGQLAVQWARGEVLDDGSDANDVPSDGVILTVRRDPSLPWWWLARVGAFARDDRPGPSERVRPGFAVLDASLGVRLSKMLQVQLLGRNLLDADYLVSADEKAVPAAGRALELSLRGVF